jgi:hypothetical protein
VFILVVALISLAACRSSDNPALSTALNALPIRATAVTDGALTVSPDGSLTVWGEWHVQEEYEIWLVEAGLPPRLLVTMPISPTLTTPALRWEDPSHILYVSTARGGNVTVTRTWRIGIDGGVEELEDSFG